LSLKKVGASHYGRLDPNLAHKLFWGTSAIFRKLQAQTSLNAAVHLVIDSSGSMGPVIGLASLAAYSLCDALTNVPGINVAATAFPGRPLKNLHGSNYRLSTVFPLLRHGQAMHRKFQLYPTGSTPLAETLWWVFQHMVPLRESRKIIVIATDSEPDSMEEAQAAIKAGLSVGLEIYGLGLGNDSVKELLPGRSVDIGNSWDLPQKLFWLLGRAMSVKR
jgi:hypothetical protein